MLYIISSVKLSTAFTYTTGMWFSWNDLNVGMGLVAVGMTAGHFLGAHTTTRGKGRELEVSGSAPSLRKTLGQRKPLAELCQCCTRKGKL